MHSAMSSHPPEELSSLLPSLIAASVVDNNSLSNTFSAHLPSNSSRRGTSGGVSGKDDGEEKAEAD